MSECIKCRCEIKKTIRTEITGGKFCDSCARKMSFLQSLCASFQKMSDKISFDKKLERHLSFSTIDACRVSRGLDNGYALCVYRNSDTGRLHQFKASVGDPLVGEFME